MLDAASFFIVRWRAVALPLWLLLCSGGFVAPQAAVAGSSNARSVRFHSALKKTAGREPYILPVEHSFLLTDAEADDLLNHNHRHGGTSMKFVTDRHLDRLVHKPGIFADDGDTSAGGKPSVSGEIMEVIIPMGELRHNHFVGTVSIGTPPQKFQMIFDTGSTNVEVVGDSCMAPSCMKVPRFAPSKSSTFAWKTNPPVSMEITFGTGKIHTRMAEDVMAIGPYKVEGQTMGIIDKEMPGASGEDVFNRIEFQGMAGFAFREMASGGHVPFFDNLMKTHNVREFAIYMGSAGQGLREKTNALSAFLIDGEDSRFYKGELQFVPVVREHYWQVELKELWIGETKFCCDEGTSNYVIVDSGTTYNTMPFEDINKFHEMVPTVDCNWDNPEFLKNFPTITYVLANNVKIELTPEMYIAEVHQRGKKMCKPAYMQIDVGPEYGHSYLLGSLVFMRNYFTVFRRGGVDGESSSVGIARAAHSPANASFLESLVVRDA